MEAVWKIDVVDFPAFIVVDDKGNDFFASIMASGSGGGAPKKLLSKQPEDVRRDRFRHHQLRRGIAADNGDVHLIPLPGRWQPESLADRAVLRAGAS